MSRFKNSRQKAFLDSIPVESLDNSTQDIGDRCKFNFSYFDNSQDAGQDFKDWTNEQIVKMLEKLKEYSKKSLHQLTLMKIGSGKQHVLEVYGSFPRKSDFTHPKHIPHQVSWARFRLEKTVRLIGFVIPKEYIGKAVGKSKKVLDDNTFYVVFLDRDHRFYKSKK